AHKDRFIAPTAAMPVQSVISPMVPHISQELPNADANINDAHGLEIAADRQRMGQFIAPTASAELAERVSIHSAPHPSDAQDALHSPRVSSKQEAHIAKEEGEVLPIRITIGRVVVRATPAAQPTPIQKRVLRPAQSLDEYLKERERGSR